MAGWWTRTRDILMIRVMIIVRPIDTDCIVIMQMPLFVARMGKVVTGVFGICFVVTGVVDVLVNIIANNVALRKSSFFLNSAIFTPHSPPPYCMKLLHNRMISYRSVFIPLFIYSYRYKYNTKMYRCKRSAMYQTAWLISETNYAIREWKIAVDAV